MRERRRIELESEYRAWEQEVLDGAYKQMEANGSPMPDFLKQRTLSQACFLSLSLYLSISPIFSLATCVRVYSVCSCEQLNIRYGILHPLMYNRNEVKH